MTILEMLELLETEIISLRARNEELQLTLRHSENDRTTTVKRSRGTSQKKGQKKVAPRRPSAKDKKTGKQITNVQLELPVPEEAAPQTRSIGKRQALGKSILQLRKSVGRPAPEHSGSLS